MPRMKNNKEMIKNRYILSFAILLIFGSCTVSKKVIRESVILNRLTEGDQKKFDYLFYEGLRQKEEGLYDQALETFNLCYQLDTLDAGLRSELGQLYAAVRQDSVATIHFEKAVELDAANWWYNIQLLTAYAKQDKIEKAIGVSEKMQKQYPEKEAIS